MGTMGTKFTALAALLWLIKCSRSDDICKINGPHCSHDGRTVQFCQNIGAAPIIQEECAKGFTCKAEGDMVSCVDDRTSPLYFRCSGRGEFPDTRNCDRTYICEGKGKPSKVCTCPSGSNVYPAGGLYCIAKECPRKNIKCSQGEFGLFQLLNGVMTSYYYYCHSAHEVEVFEYVETSGIPSTLASINGKNCIPYEIEPSTTGMSRTTNDTDTTPPTIPSTTPSTTSTMPSTTSTTSTTPSTTSTMPSTTSTTPSTTSTMPSTTSTTSTMPSTTSTTSTTPSTTSTTPSTTSTTSTTPSTTSTTPSTTSTTPSTTSTMPSTTSTTPSTTSTTPSTTSTTPSTTSTTSTTPSTTSSTSTTSTTTTITSSASTQSPDYKPVCQRPGELYRTECDCDYWRCDSNLKPKRKTCPDGMRYVVVWRKCVIGECDPSKCIYR